MSPQASQGTTTVGKSWSTGRGWEDQAGVTDRARATRSAGQGHTALGRTEDGPSGPSRFAQPRGAVGASQGSASDHPQGVTNQPEEYC